jgi:hypothetical protein
LPSTAGNPHLRLLLATLAAQSLNSAARVAAAISSATCMAACLLLAAGLAGEDKAGGSRLADADGIPRLQPRQPCPLLETGFTCHAGA